ncbi:unnamed protein product [Sphenostylis stenocarpa]|uniref:Zinc finger CCCH domain-containing protein 5 n=1 Tax=Sphenostylis stenocarpa TaxID=92480 RepID=A0AA86SSX1_9FABA|nr:unnamed protein product [Sphenostylis stenocarpa]
MQLLEQEEAERMQRDRILFQEREKAFMDIIITRQEQEQEQEREREQEQSIDHDHDHDNEFDYAVEEEGPPEIIWQGNEIIFKKKQVRVRVTDPDNHNNHSQQRGDNRPTSNPLPPESESHTQTLQDVAQQVPNFGTEQIHAMYEEVERCFEEFYEDVHTEFLKFGEIVNFKVCKNGSFHLRGNVYVQYKSLDSALLAFNSVNARYFAGKQVSCQFVNLTRWKVAICGEYMKSGFKTCSHGTACNFIHCFRNPGGDYEWADSDKPPPKFWVKKMIALFGYSDDYETSREQGNLSLSKIDSERYYSRRSRSTEMDQLNCGHSGRRKQEDERKQRTPDENRSATFKNNHKRRSRGRTPDTDSDREWLEKEENRERRHEYTRNGTFNKNRDDNRRSQGDSDVDCDSRHNEKRHGREGRNPRKCNRDIRVCINEAGLDGDRVEKRQRLSESPRHQSGDASESHKDLFGRVAMETHDYSRKSSRHRRSGLQDDYRYYETENDKADGDWSRKQSYKREHHHKKKRSKH